MLVSHMAPQIIFSGEVSPVSRRDAILATHNRTIKSVHCLVYIVYMPIQMCNGSESSLAVGAFFGAVVVSHMTSARMLVLEWKGDFGEKYTCIRLVFEMLCCNLAFYIQLLLLF